MFPIKVLNQDEVFRLLTMERTIAAVEEAYLLKSRAEAALFPVVNHEFDPGVADMDIKSGDLSGAGIFGLKLVSWFSQNPAKGLPPLIGTILVLDSATGVPKGLINATGITGMRTGAASAIGSKYLARKDASTLMMVGAGGQLPYQLLAHFEALTSIRRVVLYDPRDQDNARRAAGSIRERLSSMLDQMYEGAPHGEEIRARLGVEFAWTSDIADAASADIIVTATPAKSPVLSAELVRPGTHLSCIGADMHGKQEVGEALMPRARLFADDMHQCLSIGEMETAFARGLIRREDVAGEIGEVIAGTLKGRQHADQITLFDSTGIALQDLITAKAVLDEAEKQGVGNIIDL